MDQLKAIPRVGFQAISERAEKLYRTKPEDMKMAKRIASSIVPQLTAEANGTMAAQVGFDMQFKV